MSEILFISHHSPMAPMAMRTYGLLTQRFGRRHVTRLVNDSPQADSLVENIERKVRDCDMIVAIVDPRWNALPSLFDDARSGSQQAIRIALRAALGRAVPILPVLIDGAIMPEAHALPTEIAAFANYNAVSLRSGQAFQRDFDLLRRTILTYASLAAALARDIPSPPRARALFDWHSRGALAAASAFVIIPLLLVVVVLFQEVLQPQSPSDSLPIAPILIGGLAAMAVSGLALISMIARSSPYPRIGIQGGVTFLALYGLPSITLFTLILNNQPIIGFAANQTVARDLAYLAQPFPFLWLGVLCFVVCALLLIRVLAPRSPYPRLTLVSGLVFIFMLTLPAMNPLLSLLLFNMGLSYNQTSLVSVGVVIVGVLGSLGCSAAAIRQSIRLRDRQWQRSLVVSTLSPFIAFLLGYLAAGFVGIWFADWDLLPQIVNFALWTVLLISMMYFLGNTVAFSLIGPIGRPRSIGLSDTWQQEGEGPGAGSRIFISYRRADSADATDQIYGRLAARFKPRNVFKDVDIIPPGVDFRDYIQRWIQRTDVLLAVIGPTWATIQKGGMRRLDDPQDAVRIEIESALSAQIPVVPVLIDGAALPSAEQLPASLAPLAQGAPVRLRTSTLTHDSGLLVALIRGILRDLVRPATPRREWAFFDWRSGLGYAAAAFYGLIPFILIAALIHEILDHFFDPSDWTVPGPALAILVLGMLASGALCLVSVARQSPFPRGSLAGALSLIVCVGGPVLSLLIAQTYQQPLIKIEDHTRESDLLYLQQPIPYPWIELACVVFSFVLLFAVIAPRAPYPRIALGGGAALLIQLAAPSINPALSVLLYAITPAISEQVTNIGTLLIFALLILIATVVAALSQSRRLKRKRWFYALIASASLPLGVSLFLLVLDVVGQVVSGFVTTQNSDLGRIVGEGLLLTWPLAFYVSAGLAFAFGLWGRRPGK